MMEKIILIVNDNHPHGLEFMEEAIIEARHRGYHMKGVYSDVRGKGVREVLGRLGITDLQECPFGGITPEKPELVPRTRKILEQANPSALFLTFVGEGHFSGLFLIEANRRGLRSLVLGQGVVRGTPYFGPDTLVANEKMEKALKTPGAMFWWGPPRAVPEAVIKTGWSGLDCLQQVFDQVAFKKNLGMDPTKKLVTYMGAWARPAVFAKMTEENLKGFSEQAERNDGRLAFSPHPNMLNYQFEQPVHPGCMVHIPENVIPVSYTPMELMGTKMHWARLVDLIRASDFLILQGASGPQWLAMAMGIPIWVCNRPGLGRLPMKYPFTNYCWQTDDELEALFKGKLGLRMSEDERQNRLQLFEARLDGKTASRIVDLIDEKQS